MDSRTKRNLVTRNAFHTCLCFPPRSAMSKTRKVSPARNAIKAKYASLMPHSRRFPEEECRKRGQRSPGATGTDDVARAPRAPPSLPKVVRPLRAHCSLRAHRMSCSAMNLRLSCPRPLGSSAHTSSSTMSIVAWVGSLNSTMPRLHRQMSQIVPDFSGNFRQRRLVGQGSERAGQQYSYRARHGLRWTQMTNVE